MNILESMFNSEYDSKEEYLFSLYISELVEHGWVNKAIYHPEPIVLSEEVRGRYWAIHKEDNKEVSVPLLRGHQYTPDWEIWWNKKAHGIFFWMNDGVYKQGAFPYSKQRKQNFIPFKADGNLKSVVDIKGASVGRNNSSGVTFSTNQKWCMQCGVFVQKVVVTLDEKGIFYRTFTPRRVIIEEVYKVNGKTFKAGDSKLKYEATLIEKFTKR